MQNGSAYDVLIIGGGQAGIPLAYKLAGAGMSVALAERKDLGGSCVNFGCTPTKAVIASGGVAQRARRAAEFGLEIPDVRVDFPAVLARAKAIVEKKRGNLDKGFDGSGNPVLLRGHARFEGRGDGGFRLRVGEEDVTARQVVVNTGTRTLVPPIDGIGDVDFIEAGNWLDHEELPEKLVILGGSYIGLEMAQFYRRMGSDVTVVVGRSERVAATEDEDVTAALQEILAGEGVRFVFCERAEKVEKTAGGLKVGLDGGEPEALEATHLFLATGRRPNTEDLGLENVGIETEKGIVPTDERLATPVAGIWAAGDVRGGPMFTHTSWDDHRILVSQMAGDGSRTTDRIVPYAVFTDPELGRVGMTERQAREAGLDFDVLRFEMKNDGKAQEIGETRGFIKVLAEKGSGRILGAAVLASEGGELVHMYVDIMNAGASYTEIRDAIHIHPTLAEAVQSALF